MWDLISCYQIHDTFILLPIKNGILLVDQHAAHERILFESALKSMKTHQIESQQLLFPVVADLMPVEKALAMSSREAFRSLGYEVEDFGGNSVSVSAIPAFLSQAQASHAVREMVQFLLDEQTITTFTTEQMRYAAAFACGSAIKAGQRLCAEEMTALLNNLFATEHPYTCPHGRPTLVRMSMDELRRRFLR